MLRLGKGEAINQHDEQKRCFGTLRIVKSPSVLEYQ